MNDSDNPKSRDERASTGEEGRPEPSIVRSVSSWLVRAFARNGDATWQESLEGLIEEEGDISEQITPEERDLLMNLLRFGSLNAEDAMVPRPDIVAVEESATLEDFVEMIRQGGHSRMPVYRDTLDEIVGMVHIRDVMSYWGGTKEFQPPQIIRPVLFVPQSMPVVDLLAKMRISRLHMAVIVDEYGGTLENRMRFPLRVVEAVRKVWPNAKPLSCRLSCVDGVGIGWSIKLFGGDRTRVFTESRGGAGYPNSRDSGSPGCHFGSQWRPAGG